jgi:hypothetical protein
MLWMMKNMTKYTAAFLMGLLFISCKKYLEPDPDNSLTQDQVQGIPAYAEGLLLNAYNDMPSSTSFHHDVISDDAVSNDPASDYRLMATGSWTSSNNPVSVWNQAYKEIYYINSFMQLYTKVNWDEESKTVNDLHFQRLTGEAYGLRAWWEFRLLKYHAGKSGDGQLLGFPIILKPLTIDDDLNLPRNTFDECVDRIILDCDSAIAELPPTYADISGDADYNQGMGQRWTNRMDGYAARALKSCVLLWAASPAFNPSDDAARWVDAAQAAGELLKLNGGIASLSPTGLTWYTDNTDPEIIWARAISSSHNLEASNFPPSLLGSGNTNPTQELVNAFPMENGYPISDALSAYDPSHPYANRDPRLSAYILYNKNVLGAKGEISTYMGAPKDGINAQTNSTRTGYYLKKFMLDNVSVSDPVVNQQHFKTYFRFTEIFLNYAEAANEAYGPDADPDGYGFTARDVIAAIRKRAGIKQPDTYLASVKTKDDFRKLVHNERRLELCFEGQRFNDLRRWNDLQHFKETVTGAFISQTGTVPPYAYSYQQVEPRSYQDYMIYGPIPKNEILKSDKLKQNEGW